MKLVLVTLVILGIAMAGFLVRLFFVKNAEVRGGCASKNPLLANETGTCPACGAVPTGKCAENMPEIKA